MYTKENQIFKNHMLGVANPAKRLNRKSELEDLLGQMGGSFESANFEDEKNFNLAVASMNPLQKSAMMNAMRRNKGITHSVGEATAGMVHQLVAESKGDLNLTITRTGVAITSPLPFILFGSNDFTAGYASTFNGLMQNVQPGTTVVVSADGLGNVLFTYTNGGNTDVVKVENLGNINYKSFLASMNNNYFATKYFLVSISDENQNLSQFAQPLKFGVLSALGMANSNQLVFRSRTNSWMFRKDRIEVIVPEQTITPDFSFAMSIVQVDGMQVGFDFFMSRRININKI